MITITDDVSAFSMPHGRPPHAQGQALIPAGTNLERTRIELWKGVDSGDRDDRQDELRSAESVDSADQLLR